MIKIPDKLGIEGNYLKIIKAIYEKPTNNSVLNGESKSFAFKGTNKTETPTLITAIDIALEVLTRAIRQEKERKVIKIAKKKMNLCSQMVWS